MYYHLEGKTGYIALHGNQGACKARSLNNISRSFNSLDNHGGLSSLEHSHSAACLFVEYASFS